MDKRLVFIAFILLVSCNSANRNKKQLERDSIIEQRKADSIKDANFEKAVAKYHTDKLFKKGSKVDSLIELERANYEAFKAQFDTLYSLKNSTVTIKGIIQSSGIREGDSMGIKADFQIENPKMAFFLVTQKDLSPYWGKCVSVKGRYVKGWNVEKRFDRSALYLDSIKTISSDYCFNSPYFKPVGKEMYEIFYRDTIVKGLIVRSKRRAPDIGEDYCLKLEKPVYNLEDGWGETTNFFISLNMDLDSLNNVIENEKKVTLYGLFKGGYTESIIFSCKKVINIESN